MTSFTIHRSALLPALDRVGRVVERRNTIPILANLRLTADGLNLTLTGTDLDIEMTATAELLATGTGDFTLPSTLLGDFVKKLPESATIEFAETDGGRVRVSSGRTRAALPFLPASDYPAMTAGTFDTSMSIEPSALSRILSTVQFAISSEETRYYLCGIYFHLVEDEGASLLRAVSTDGHRLARSEMPAPEGAAGMQAVILPSKTVIEMLRLMKGKDETPVTLDISTSKVRLTLADGSVLTSKLIDGTYPDYQRVIPQGNPHRYAVKAGALSAAVDRVTTVSSERGRAVRFRFTPAEVELDCQNPDTGHVTDTIAVDSAEGGADTEIGFNGHYCHAALAGIAGETATFALNGSGDPAVITGANPADLFVLMPMRV